MSGGRRRRHWSCDRARAWRARGAKWSCSKANGSLAAGLAPATAKSFTRASTTRQVLTKTRLCVEGKAMLYAFCREYGVPHRRCGKILVATTEGRSGKTCAPIKGAGRSQRRHGSGLARRRRGAGARTSACCNKGAAFRPRPASLIPTPSCWPAGRRRTARRDAGSGDAGGFRPSPPQRGLIIETGGPNPTQIAAKIVVNSAGLGAQAVARSISRNAARKDSAAASGQGQLFRPRGALALFALDLSDADAGGTRSPFDIGHQRPSPLRSGCRMDRRDRLRRRSRRGGTPSMRRFAPIGRACPMARCSRTIRA